MAGNGHWFFIAGLTAGTTMGLEFASLLSAVCKSDGSLPPPVASPFLLVFCGWLVFSLCLYFAKGL